MDIEDYVPEFYELITEDGRRFLSYRCFKCNKNHLIRTTSKEISKIRASYRIVNKNKNQDDRLLLHCGKGETPDYDGDGIQIVLTPKSAITKPERDKLRKRIERIKQQIPQVYLSSSEIISAEKMITDKLKRYDQFAEQLIEAKEELNESLEKLKKVN